MNLKGKVSKVAICKRCKKHLKVCHIDYLDKSADKEFTELTNEGFIVKVETIAATQKREMGLYSECSKKICTK